MIISVWALLKNQTSFCFSTLFFKNLVGNQPWLNCRYRFHYTAVCWLKCQHFDAEYLSSAVHADTTSHFQPSHTVAKQIAPFLHSSVRSSWQHNWCNVNHISTHWNELFSAFQSCTADHCVKRSLCSVLLSHSLFGLCFFLCLLGFVVNQIQLHTTPYVFKTFLCLSTWHLNSSYCLNLSKEDSCMESG